MHGHKTVVSPVVFKEVFDPTDDFFAKWLSSVELTQHSNPLAQISVVSDLVDRTEIDNDRHELVHNDGENSYTKHENNCSHQFFNCRFGTEITEANRRQGRDGIIEHLSQSLPRWRYLTIIFYKSISLIRVKCRKTLIHIVGVVHFPVFYISNENVPEDSQEIRATEDNDDNCQNLICSYSFDDLHDWKTERVVVCEDRVEKFLVIIVINDGLELLHIKELRQSRNSQQSEDSEQSCFVTNVYTSNSRKNHFNWEPGD